MEGLFLLVPVCVGVGFVFVFGIIAVTIFRNLAERARNNAMPVESVPATVVAKRTDTSGMSGSMVTTTYYATFEHSDGERIEFRVSGEEFGRLVEGDRGALTHQGTRYEGFDRE